MTGELPTLGAYTYSLWYEEFIAPLLATVQMQNTALTQQKEQLTALEAT